MAVIVMASSKGGVGKSTTALCLAHTFAEAGGKTAILDGDPNQPIANWHKVTTEHPDFFEVVPDVTEDTIIEEIEAAKKRSQFIIVDLEGSANLAMSYAIAMADLVLIPVQGSQLDASEAAKIISFIKRNDKTQNRKTNFRIFYSRAPNIKARTGKHIFSEFDASGIPRMTTEMTERDAFRAIFSFGGTLWDLTDKEVSAPSKAQDNMRDFVEEVLLILKGARK